MGWRFSGFPIPPGHPLLLPGKTLLHARTFLVTFLVTQSGRTKWIPRDQSKETGGLLHDVPRLMEVQTPNPQADLLAEPTRHGTKARYQRVALMASPISLQRCFGGLFYGVQVLDVRFGSSAHRRSIPSAQQIRNSKEIELDV